MSKAFNNVAKLRGIVDVTEPRFGAKGDGTTDDTAAIQAAIDAVYNRANIPVPLESTVGGGFVFLPAGSYKVTSTLTLRSRVGLCGEGDRVTYIDGSDIASGAVIETEGHGSSVVVSHADIKDLTIYGDSSGGSINGIHYSAWASSIERVQIKNCGDGIVLGSSGNSNSLVETTITRCKIHECTNGIVGAGSAKATDIRIIDNTINACDESGIESTGTGGWQIIGNNIYNCNNLINFVTVIASNVIAGNYLGEANLGPLVINPGNSSNSGAIAITGNVFKTANNAGGGVTTSDKSVISLVNNGAATDLESVTIQGNVIRDGTGNALYGIYISGTCSKLVIGPNVYEGSFTKEILFPTTKTGISVCEPQIGLYAVAKVPTEVTIATGNIPITGNVHYVDTEADAATDDLYTISGDVFAGMELTLYAADSARTVVVKDSTLELEGDCSLDNTEDSITLLYDGTTWREKCRSNNGA